MREKYPDEITAECDKWKSRRTADSFGLLKSYLCYDAESRQISDENYSKNVQEMIGEAVNKGTMGTFPDRLGTAVFNGDTLGIYVGDDDVIYAKSVADGIVREKISDGKWMLWFEVPDVKYGEECVTAQDRRVCYPKTKFY